MTLNEALRVLGLPNKTNLREARAAYFRLAKKYHPDVSDGDTAEKFLLIVEAYEFLKDYVRGKRGQRRKRAADKAAVVQRAVVDGSPGALVVASGDPWRTHVGFYDRKFADFVIEIENGIREADSIFEKEGGEFTSRVYSRVGQRIGAYSEASQIRSRLHKDVNQILQEEGLNFVKKLTRRLRLAVTDFDNWLATMRGIAVEHSLPRTLAEYASLTSGVVLTCGLFIAFFTVSCTLAWSTPWPWAVAALLTVGSVLGSLFGGRRLYVWARRQAVRATSQRFLAELDLVNLEKGRIPISTEATAPENVSGAMVAGGFTGLGLGAGPIGIVIGAVVGAILGALSGGKSFEEFRQEVARNTANALGPILDDFLRRVRSQIQAESRSIIGRMKENLVRNMKDERLVYGFGPPSTDGATAPRLPPQGLESPP